MKTAALNGTFCMTNAARAFRLGRRPCVRVHENPGLGLLRVLKVKAFIEAVATAAVALV